MADQDCASVLRHEQLPSVRGQTTTRTNHRSGQLQTVPKRILENLYLKETFFPFFSNPLQCTKKGCEQKKLLCVRVCPAPDESRQAWNSCDLFSPIIMFRVFVPTITNLRNTKQTKYFYVLCLK